MNTETITETAIDSLVAWAKVSCHLFMQGRMPPNFRHQDTKKSIEGEAVYGNHVFGCTVSSEGEGVYRFRAYIFDTDTDNDFLFHTSDIIVEGV
jgi:hypothetical protein